MAVRLTAIVCGGCTSHLLNFPFREEHRPLIQRERETIARKLERVLLERKLIDSATLERMRAIARDSNQSLIEALYRQRAVASDALVALLGELLQLPVADLRRDEVSTPEALALLPEAVARHYEILPLEVKEDAVVLAVGDPLNVGAMEELRMQLRRRIEIRLAPIPDIEDAITIHYRQIGGLTQSLEFLDDQDAPTGPAGLIAEDVDDTPAVRTVNQILTRAVKDRASDIHIDPQRDRVSIRYRIDGILVEVVTLPLGIQRSVVRRIKVLADLNPSEHRRPQDGQLTFSVDGQEVDVRVAIAWSIYGEVVALRLLNRSASLFSLERLGFSPECMAIYEQLLLEPFGMILVSGPTGSGKTTSLYASLNRVDRREQNVMTIEDPVEYRFQNANQLQVSERYGISFATGLRAIMRLDPDVILVGEIRDSETAQIAAQSALTGHLVLTSIHANDAAAALFRLQTLGVDRSTVASSVLGVVAQRMVRKICPHCRTTRSGSALEARVYRAIMGDERKEFDHGAGCSFCAQTGFLGRTGIFELLEVAEGTQQLIADGATAAQLRDDALRRGMTPMRKDGMTKVRDGITSPTEVIRQTGSIHTL